MIVVQHRTGQYSIEFLEIAEVRRRLGQGCFVVSDENVARHWGGAIGDLLPTLVLPPGEPTKSVAMLERVARWLAQSGATRRSKVVAFGGGVIGDLAGLAAATYMRGIELIQVPTTLLAQVDSSVGGKVGIDLPEGKNLVGAFHAPTAVWIPLEALSTLPKREFINGAAEVWKYAFAVDSALLSSLESHPLVPESPKLKEVIARCIDLKRQIVEQDERDERGIRAVLNFGHTIGHALERASNYESLLHGEAIAIGMAVEARIGEELELSPTGMHTAEATVLMLPRGHGLVHAPIGDSQSVINYACAAAVPGSQRTTSENRPRAHKQVPKLVAPLSEHCCIAGSVGDISESY